MTRRVFPCRPPLVDWIVGQKLNKRSSGRGGYDVTSNAHMHGSSANTARTPDRVVARGGWRVSVVAY
jgi:hypothetical protein